MVGLAAATKGKTMETAFENSVGREKAKLLQSLTTDKIKSCLAAAGMSKMALTHNNIYNQIRCGDFGLAVGACYSGATAKKKTKILRKAFRELLAGMETPAV